MYLKVLTFQFAHGPLYQGWIPYLILSSIPLMLTSTMLTYLAYVVSSAAYKSSYLTTSLPKWSRPFHLVIATAVITIQLAGSLTVLATDKLRFSSIRHLGLGFMSLTVGLRYIISMFRLRSMLSDSIVLSKGLNDATECGVRGSNHQSHLVANQPETSRISFPTSSRPSHAVAMKIHDYTMKPKAGCISSSENTFSPSPSGAGTPRWLASRKNEPIVRIEHSTNGNSGRVLSSTRIRGANDQKEKTDLKPGSSLKESKSITGTMTSSGMKNRDRENQVLALKEGALKRINRLILYGLAIATVGLSATSYTAANQIPSNEAYSTETDEEARVYSVSLDIVNWAAVFANTYSILYAHNGNSKAKKVNAVKRKSSHILTPPSRSGREVTNLN